MHQQSTNKKKIDIVSNNYSNNRMPDMMSYNNNIINDLSFLNKNNLNLVNTNNIVTEIPIFQKSELKKKVPPIRYHKQLFQTNTPDQKKIDSAIYILENNNNTLKLNIFSSAFDGNFNVRTFSRHDVVKNYDGSIDLAFQFEKKK